MIKLICNKSGLEMEWGNAKALRLQIGLDVYECPAFCEELYKVVLFEEKKKIKENFLALNRQENGIAKTNAFWRIYGMDEKESKEIILNERKTKSTILG